MRHGDQQTDPEWRAEELKFNVKLGSNIVAARHRAGVAQHALALVARLPYSRVAHLELGRATVSINELQQIADALGVAAVSLLPTSRERIAR